MCLQMVCVRNVYFVLLAGLKINKILPTYSLLDRGNDNWLIRYQSSELKEDTDEVNSLQHEVHFLFTNYT